MFHFQVQVEQSAGGWLSEVEQRSQETSSPDLGLEPTPGTSLVTEPVSPVQEVHLAAVCTGEPPATRFPEHS